MNVFFSDTDPVKAAQALDDKRVIKMALETAQILSTVLREYWHEADSFLYKSTHKSHPCVIWASRSWGNFLWLYRHGKALCTEYNYRFGGHHKSEQVIDHALDLGTKVPIDSLTMTMPANCSQVSCFTKLTENYKTCLMNKWDKDKLTPRWTNRGRPAWQ